jgi:hypothetical protein
VYFEVTARRMASREISIKLIVKYLSRRLLLAIARNGPVYAGIPYRKFFLLLNFLPTLINIYIYILLYPFMLLHFSDTIYLFCF